MSNTEESAVAPEAAEKDSSSTDSTSTSLSVIDPSVGRTERLDALLRNHVLAASGVGLVPIPLVDIAGTVAVQLDLAKKISNEYGITFDQARGKSILVALIGSIVPAAVGGTAMSLLKCLPVIGNSVSALALPAFFGATTYAVHKVFVKHYEAGGTLLDLDAAKMKAYFKEQFKMGGKASADVNAGSAA